VFSLQKTLISHQPVIIPLLFTEKDKYKYKPVCTVYYQIQVKILKQIHHKIISSV